MLERIVDFESEQLEIMHLALCQSWVSSSVEKCSDPYTRRILADTTLRMSST